MMLAGIRDELMAKVTVTAFVDEDIKEGLKALADVERRSLSQMIALLIEDAVEKARQEGKIPSAKQGDGKRESQATVNPTPLEKGESEPT
ncbi:MAG: hypothetical protein ACAF41_12515 [Leptolyngbya sp. BL-A-14]